MKSLIHKVYNCDKKSAAAGIINGLIWALVIILGTWLTRGSDYADVLFIFMLSAFTIAFLFIERERKNK